MNILDIAIAKKLAGGGGGSGTDNYNDLSNLPKINDTTLSGNKSSSALGLQSEINSDSKLASDLVDDTNQDNKFVTSTEKNTWNGKQNAIDADHKLSSDLVDDANKTNKFVTSTEKNTWNGKQNAIDSDHKLSSSLVSFTEAEAAALASGINSSKVGQISTNQTNILYAIEKVGKNLVPLKNDVLTNNGVTITIEDSIVTVNGKSNSGLTTITLATFTLKAGTYKISGGSDSATGADFFMRLGKAADDSYISYSASNAPVNEFTLASDTNVKLTILLNASVGQVTNVKFYPMICDKDIYDQSSSFVPYGAPNYDLTRMVNDLQKKAVKVYTYHVNPNESDPENAVTYLDDATGLTPAKMGASSFSYGSWANAWFLPRPCVLKFDGTVDYYLNPNDYSKKTDGTASTIDSSNTTGNVMLEFPKIWVKRVNDGNGARTVSIAPVNVDGTYKCWSNINADNQEIDHFYLPAYNGTVHSSKLRSLSGVTLDATYAPDKTRAEEITLATANNPSGKTMWCTEVWADFCLIYDLLYLMGKSLDVQRTFGQGITSGGETAMRAYVTGTHNTKGLFYGDTSGTSTAVKALGIENLWGCRGHSVAGVIVDNSTLKIKMTYGNADSSMADGYNTNGTGYLIYGSINTNTGYITKMQADNIMGYKVIATGGSDATYYCDQLYLTQDNHVYYGVIGGNATDSAGCGFEIAFSSMPTRVVWHIGASLSCKPQS